MSARTVLVVEDDDLAAVTLVRVLRRGGHTVSRCASVAEATAAVERSVPDVLVVDRHLPDGDGLQFGHQLRERLGQGAPRVVLLSGDAIRLEEQTQVDVFLHKPADLRSLLAAVE